MSTHATPSSGNADPSHPPGDSGGVKTTASGGSRGRRSALAETQRAERRGGAPAATPMALGPAPPPFTFGGPAAEAAAAAMCGAETPPRSAAADAAFARMVRDSLVAPSRAGGSAATPTAPPAQPAATPAPSAAPGASNLSGCRRARGVPSGAGSTGLQHPQAPSHQRGGRGGMAGGRGRDGGPYQRRGGDVGSGVGREPPRGCDAAVGLGRSQLVEPSARSGGAGPAAAAPSVATVGPAPPGARPREHVAEAECRADVRPDILREQQVVQRGHQHPTLASERVEAETFVWGLVSKEYAGKNARFYDVGAGSGLRGTKRGLGVFNHVHMLSPVMTGDDLFRSTHIPATRTLALPAGLGYETSVAGVTVCTHKLRECMCWLADNRVYMFTHSAYYLEDADLEVIPDMARVYWILHKFEGDSGLLAGEYRYTVEGGRVKMVPLGGAGSPYSHPDITGLLYARKWRLSSGRFVYATEVRVFGHTSVYQVLVSASDLPMEPIPRPVRPAATMGEQSWQLDAVMTRVPILADAQQVALAGVQAANHLVKVNRWGLDEAHTAVASRLDGLRNAQSHTVAAAAADRRWRSAFTSALTADWWSLDAGGSAWPFILHVLMAIAAWALIGGYLAAVGFAPAFIAFVRVLCSRSGGGPTVRGWLWLIPMTISCWALGHIIYAQRPDWVVGPDGNVYTFSDYNLKHPTTRVGLTLLVVVFFAKCMWHMLSLSWDEGVAPGKEPPDSIIGRVVRRYL